MSRWRSLTKSSASSGRVCQISWTAATCRRFPRARRIGPTQSGLVRPHCYVNVKRLSKFFLRRPARLVESSEEKIQCSPLDLRWMFQKIFIASRSRCGNCGKLGALLAESFPSAVGTVGKSLSDFSTVSTARQFPQRGAPPGSAGDRAALWAFPRLGFSTL
jgi:hypothetical protein